MEEPKINLRTQESQYQYIVESISIERKLGLMSGQVWNDDPKRLCFLLSRYKFVSRLLKGKKNALEVGCADGFGTRIVRQTVPNVTGIDFDPIFIENAKSIKNDNWNIDFIVHDIVSGSLNHKFDSAYALDVLEHIPHEKENIFVSNIVESLSQTGVLILGTPTIESQKYASKPSLEGHVNCKDEPSMRHLLNGFFDNVFIFSMNDEVVHTGFTPMAHYIFGIGVGNIRGK
jgi:2-polyprenyl-3-methyl-5-hydroxy-6-metoxy-1,4-benzoquinol methylase